MNTATLFPQANALHDSSQPGVQASAVSWRAILAGAAAAAALSLILLVLGTGLGLSVVSPWSHKGIEAESLGVSTIVWLTLTQLFASGLGGYLAGRLRTRWLATDPDEVYFRDTAHGFLAWVVASLATAALLTSVIGTVVATGVKAGGAVAGAAGATASAGAVAAVSDLSKADSDTTRTDYFMDTLFRGTPAAPASTAPATAGVAAGTQPSGNSQQMSEVTRIFMNTVRTGPLPAEDAAYAAQLVAQRTGLTQQEAEKRVADVYTRMQTRFTTAQTAAREAADKARKTSAYAALWIFISLLGGAFVASVTAIYGGRQRDL